MKREPAYVGISIDGGEPLTCKDRNWVARVVDSRIDTTVQGVSRNDSLSGAALRAFDAAIDELSRPCRITLVVDDKTFVHNMGSKFVGVYNGYGQPVHRLYKYVMGRCRGRHRVMVIGGDPSAELRYWSREKGYNSTSPFLPGDDE